MPTNIELTEIALRIDWDDGVQQTIPFVRLREECPCATCREKRTAEAAKPIDPLQVIEPHQAVETKVVGMRPVGAYGYAIKFSDGHSTGIYTLDRLRDLSTQ